MAVLLANYLDTHGATIRSENAARRACALCLEYLTAVTGSAAATVADFSLPRQHAFMRWLREKRLSAKTIASYLGTIKAAANLGARPTIIIDSTGKEREAKFLTAPIFVDASEKTVCKVTGAPASKPRDYLPTFEIMAKFLDAIPDDPEHEHVFRYTIIALNTWARPEAIIKADFNKQADFETGLLDLNQPGRAQTNKYRPIIRLTANLRGWLLHWDDGRPLRYFGRPVDHIDLRTLKKIARPAGADRLTFYTLRHFMNTRAMGVPKAIKPDREERAMWMGHHDPHFGQTAHYERFDPSYLQGCLAATDAIMTKLDGLTTRALFAPGTVSGTGLTVIDGTGRAG